MKIVFRSGISGKIHAGQEIVSFKGSKYDGTDIIRIRFKNNSELEYFAYSMYQNKLRSEIQNLNPDDAEYFIKSSLFDFYVLDDNSAICAKDCRISHFSNDGEIELDIKMGIVGPVEDMSIFESDPVQLSFDFDTSLQYEYQPIFVINTDKPQLTDERKVYHVDLGGLDLITYSFNWDSIVMNVAGKINIAQDNMNYMCHISGGISDEPGIDTDRL